MPDTEPVSTPAAPDLVAGRDEELRRLGGLLSGLAAGQGAATALLGEAGIGKTHVVRAAVARATRSGLDVSVGRCVPGALVSYRPVREAVLSRSRSHPLPSGAEARRWLRGLAPLLEVPDPEEPDPVSPDFVADAVLRLFGGAPAPGLLVLEDLHWADAETLAVVEYLADHAPEVAFGLVVTLRPGELAPADELVRRLHARDALTTLRLGPLALDDVAVWVHERLGPVPHDVVSLVHARSGGNPLLLNELVDELAAVPREELANRAASTLPLSVRDSVRTKLGALAGPDAEVVQSAALVGLGDLALLATASGRPESETRAAVANGLAAGLLEPDPVGDGAPQFRHELVREAVLATTPADLRSTAARRALRVLAPADLATIDDEDLVEQLERLAGPAQEKEVAARAALRGAVLTFDRWAFAAAERWLARARVHAGTGPALVNDIDLVQLRVSAASGHGRVVRRVGRALLARLPDDDVESRLEVLLRLAQVAGDVGDVAETHRLLEDAEPLLAVVDDACSRTKHRLAAAAAALAADDRELAARLAAEARELARPEPDQRDLDCSSLVVLGQCRWPDTAAARQAWQEGLDLADAQGMRLWRGRMEVCLARAAVADLGGDASLGDVRAVAREAGAPVLEAQAIALQAELALLRWQPGGVRRLLAEADRNLEQVTPPQPLRASLAAVRDLCSVLEGHEPDGDSADVLIELLSGREPGESTVVDGGATTAGSALVDLARLAPDAPRGRGSVRDAIARVAHRLGAGGDATLALREASVVLSEASWLRALVVLRASPALVAHGPSPDLRDLLRDAIGVFDGLPAGAAAAERCRDLIRRAGAPYPRRTSAQAGVPEGLRRHGITAREWQVLRLVGDGLTSREIGEQLFLSPRTVEKHVQRMLSKTGAANRTALAALSRSAVVT